MLILFHSSGEIYGATATFDGKDITLKPIYNYYYKNSIQGYVAVVPSGELTVSFRGTNSVGVLCEVYTIL